MLKTGLSNLTPSQGGDLQVHFWQKEYPQLYGCSSLWSLSMSALLPERTHCLQVGKKTEMSHQGLAEIQPSQKRFLIRGKLLLSHIKVFWTSWFCLKYFPCRDANWDGWSLDCKMVHLVTRTIKTQHPRQATSNWGREVIQLKGHFGKWFGKDLWISTEAWVPLLLFFYLKVIKTTRLIHWSAVCEIPYQVIKALGPSVTI